MYAGGSIFFKRQKVFFGAVAHIAFKSVIGIDAGKSFHQPVPGDLCQYGSGSNGYAAAVPAGQGDKAGSVQG